MIRPKHGVSDIYHHTYLLGSLRSCPLWSTKQTIKGSCGTHHVSRDGGVIITPMTRSTETTGFSKTMPLSVRYREILAPMANAEDRRR